MMDDETGKCWEGEMKEKTLNRKYLEIELKKLIESVVVTIGETNRIMSEKEYLTEFEKGRTQGIFLVSKDFIDNLKSFGYRTGILK